MNRENKKSTVGGCLWFKPPRGFFKNCQFLIQPYRTRNTQKGVFQMKKLLILVMFAVIGTAAFAQIPEFKLSAGGGGLFAAGFGGGVEDPAYSEKDTFVNIGGGAYAFFDATFAELAVGFQGGSATDKYEDPGFSAEDKGSFMAIDISLLAKWPFIFGKLTVFPLLGIDYQIVLSRKWENGDQYTNPNGDEAPMDFNALWFQLGAGVDYAITDALYVRGEILYGIRLKNQADKDWKDGYSYTGSDIKNLLGHGPTFKIGVGYKF
jgi:opacity protein-like surface antigen